MSGKRMAAPDPKVCGLIRGTVAEAVEFALEHVAEFGERMICRVEHPRSELPPNWQVQQGRKTPDQDGPTWLVFPSSDLTPEAAR